MVACIRRTWPGMQWDWAHVCMHMQSFTYIYIYTHILNMDVPVTTHLYHTCIYLLAKHALWLVCVVCSIKMPVQKMLIDNDHQGPKVHPVKPIGCFDNPDDQCLRSILENEQLANRRRHQGLRHKLRNGILRDPNTEIEIERKIERKSQREPKIYIYIHSIL